jgi:hypothetical protein
VLRVARSRSKSRRLNRNNLPRIPFNQPAMRDMCACLQRRRDRQSLPSVLIFRANFREPIRKTTPR